MQQIMNSYPYIPTVYPVYYPYNAQINNTNAIDNWEQNLSPDEKKFLYDGNIESLQALLFQRDKKDLVLKTAFNSSYTDTYEKVKDNKDFQELLKTNYYSGTKGFINLVDTAQVLEQERVRRGGGSYLNNLSQNNHVLYSRPYIEPINYSKYNVDDYLRMLNDFAKTNKCSDDFKRYIIATKSKNIDSYYKSFDKVNSNQDIVTLFTYS